MHPRILPNNQSTAAHRTNIKHQLDIHIVHNLRDFSVFALSLLNAFDLIPCLGISVCVFV